MAKNFIQDGTTITLVAPANVLSGQAILVGSFFGVANYDALSGLPVEVTVEGVWQLPKAAVALAQGDKVWWDDVAKNVTSVATANKLIGGVTEAAGSGALTARVRLNENTVS